MLKQDLVRMCNPLSKKGYFVQETLLLIDDNEFAAIYLEEFFGDKYKLIHCFDGESGFASALKSKPSLILMDVEMPGMNGYDACRLIKKSPATHEIPVIFVSAKIDPADRLAGYEAGGDDYVTKPFMPDVMIRKIEALLRRSQKNRELTEAAQLAQTTAMTAISTVGDVGVIMRFLGELVSCLDFSSVAACVFRTMESFGLDISLQLRQGNDSVSRSSQGICSPLEVSVLTNMATCGRIVDLGRRSAFNFPRASIIVRDMPKENSDLYGRIKDNLATIVESVDAHLQSLELIDGALQRGDTLMRMLQTTVGTLHDIDSRYRKQRVASSQILNTLIHEIEESFVHLGLTEGQEHFLQTTLRNAVDQAQALFDQELEVDNTMKSLNENLDSFLSQEVESLKAESDLEESRIELF
jgi:CheY-like chemotaxis protein